LKRFGEGFEEIVRSNTSRKKVPNEMTFASAWEDDDDSGLAKLWICTAFEI
jgi:hypothetical protein